MTTDEKKSESAEPAEPGVAEAGRDVAAAQAARSKRTATGAGAVAGVAAAAAGAAYVLGDDDDSEDGRGGAAAAPDGVAPDDVLVDDPSAPAADAPGPAPSLDAFDAPSAPAPHARASGGEGSAARATAQVRRVARDEGPDDDGRPSPQARVAPAQAHAPASTATNQPDAPATGRQASVDAPPTTRTRPQLDDDDPVAGAPAPSGERESAQPSTTAAQPADPTPAADDEPSAGAPPSSDAAPAPAAASSAPPSAASEPATDDAKDDAKDGAKDDAKDGAKDDAPAAAPQRAPMPEPPDAPEPGAAAPRVAQPAPAGPIDTLEEFQAAMHAKIAAWKPPPGADPARAAALREDLQNLVDRTRPEAGGSLKEAIDEFDLQMRDQLDQFRDSETIDAMSDRSKAAEAQNQARQALQEAATVEAATARAAYDVANAQYGDYKEALKDYVEAFKPEWGSAVRGPEEQKFHDDVIAQIDKLPALDPNQINDVRAAQVKLGQFVDTQMRNFRDIEYANRLQEGIQQDQQYRQTADQAAQNLERRNAEFDDQSALPLQSQEAIAALQARLSPPDQELYPYLGLSPTEAAQQRATDVSNAAWAEEQSARFPNDEVERLAGEAAWLAQAVPDGTVTQAEADAAWTAYQEADQAARAERAEYVAQFPNEQVADLTTVVNQLAAQVAAGGPMAFAEQAQYQAAVANLQAASAAASSVAPAPAAPAASDAASGAPVDAFDAVEDGATSAVGAEPAVEVAVAEGAVAPAPAAPAAAEEDALGVGQVQADVAARAAQTTAAVPSDETEAPAPASVPTMPDEPAAEPVAEGPTFEDVVPLVDIDQPDDLDLGPAGAGDDADDGPPDPTSDEDGLPDL